MNINFRFVSVSLRYTSVYNQFQTCVVSSVMLLCMHFKIFHFSIKVPICHVVFARGLTRVLPPLTTGLPCLGLSACEGQ